MVDEMQLLARIRSELPTEALDTSRSELLFRTKLGSGQPETRTPRLAGWVRGTRSDHRRPVLWGLSGAAVAAVAVAAVLVTSVAPHAPTVPGGRSTHGLSAAVVLHAAAREAASISPVPEPAANQWIYTSTVQVQNGQRSTSDNWTQFDGLQNAYRQNGKLITHTVTYMQNGTQVPDTALANPLPAGTNPLVAYNGMPMSSYTALASLKQPPATLLNDVAQAVAGGGGTPSQGTTPSPALASKEFNFLAQLLWNASLVPTGTEANVFNALATLPGITLQQNQTDAAGQPAVAIGTTGTNSKQLLFDPNSYRVLGIRWTTTTPASAGEATSTSTTSLAYANVALVAAAGDH